MAPLKVWASALADRPPMRMARKHAWRMGFSSRESRPGSGLRRLPCRYPD
jgi:hypothetical protein